MISEIVKSIEYPAAYGRLSVVNMLKLLALKLPLDLVKDQSEVFFLPLVLRVVNDSNSDVALAAEKATQVCIFKSNRNKLHHHNMRISR